MDIMRIAAGHGDTVSSLQRAGAVVSRWCRAEHVTRVDCTRPPCAARPCYRSHASLGTIASSLFVQVQPTIHSNITAIAASIHAGDTVGGHEQAGAAGMNQPGV